MIISDEFKFVYIDVPKTASTSFERLFREQFFGKTVYPSHDKKTTKHCREIPEHATDYTKVISVRNPYERASSLYSYHLRVTDKTQDACSFENFLDVIIENQEKYESDNYLMYLPIHRYLSPMTLTSPVYFIQLENATEQVNLLPFVHEPLSMTHHNITKKKISVTMTDAIIEKIKTWAGSDFKMGGYDENITSFS